MYSWSNFARPATHGNVHHRSKFSLFVDNGSHCGALQSQSLGNVFVTPSILTDVNDFLSQLFEIFQPTSLFQTGSI